MLVNGLWRAVCVLLCCVGVSVCVRREEYEVNYADNYDNAIEQSQQDGDTPESSCQASERSRWDKLFVALEDSHMRQTMLMEALERHCEAPGVCQQCLPAIEAVCRGQAEQVSPRLQQDLLELKEEVIGRERRLNASLHLVRQEGAEGFGSVMAVLQQLLQSARLQRLEEGRLRQYGPIRAGHGETQPPRTGTAVPVLGAGLGAAEPKGEGYGENSLGLGEGLSGTGRPIGRKSGTVGANLWIGLGMKPQEVTSSPPSSDRGKIERALVAIAMELQKVQAQLSLLSSVGNE
ncbi:uncharacterized protein LOC105019801 [Esox lucius]|uniref:uncharacterized protein LOC105019801 n=1 Tax=Esox lucius TaxID=8010 RepID=UPI0005770511|nr:uncharacterized protein LOC105019801 [Esox lucius]